MFKSTGVALAVALASVVACVAPAVVAAEPATKPAVDETQQLRDDLAVLRQQLAQARLDLQSAQRDLEDIKQYLATKDAAADVQRWSAQRQAMEEERAQLALERKKLEAARASLRDITRGQAAAADRNPAPPAAAPVPVAVAPDDPRWELDYKVALIPLNNQVELTYVDPIGGDLLLQRFPQVERRHMKLRGTLQNRSTAPWRYTFEVRLADQRGNIIGRWRYQTPVLGPNELHQIEVTVPVTDIALVRQYQIGNIEADRPAAVIDPATQKTTFPAVAPRPAAQPAVPAALRPNQQP